MHQSCNQGQAFLDNTAMIRITFLDKLIDEWANLWIATWFVLGSIALLVGFALTTEQTPLDWFYLMVSMLGLLCVVGLSFRKNKLGNGFGMAATAGEVIVQGTSGAVGLMLAPLFNFFTHAYALRYWSKNTDGDGQMIPKSATKQVWLITILFLVIGLAAFPALNEFLTAQGFGIIQKDGGSFLGKIDFFWINVLAFVLSITAQITMILRYSFNWWLWILVNAVWLIVNLMTGNFIFAIQSCIYQINAIIGLYEWQRNAQ